MRGLPAEVPSYLAEPMREYQLGKLFGCAPSALLDEPAWKLSWWIEIDRLSNEVTGG